MKIFAGTSNKHLLGDFNLSVIYHHQFPSGEQYCQFRENIRGEDVFLVQSICKPANDNLMQLLVMADAARRASAGRITAVIPYFGYARQDRKEKSRVPISAKLVMDLIEASGIDRILTMDLHSAQIGGFTNLPLDHLSFQPLLIKHIKEKYHSLALRDSVVVVAPDVGAVKKGELFAEKLGCDFAFISKKRVNDNTVSLTNFVGNVKRKTVIIIDDLTESCGTLIQAAQECKRQGAVKVIAAVTHFCFTEEGMTRLSDEMPFPNRPDIIPSIDELIHSDTVDYWWSFKYKPSNITKIEVGKLFRQAIHNIHKNESVSSLFT